MDRCSFKFLVLNVYSGRMHVFYLLLRISAIDGEQWGVNHDGFDFDLPNTAVVGEIPPPAVAATGVQGRPRSTSAKQRAAQSSTERTKSRSPDRPIFACRAFNTSACLANKQQAGDGDGDTEVLAATPLSPSPFLQSKYVSGVFLVANKEGQKMIVRGPPIVSPIWYVHLAVEFAACVFV